MSEVKTNKFKENWNKVDELCPHCNQVTKKQKGLTKQNLKRLITFKGGNMNDWIITIVIILVLVLAYAYKTETAKCREWITPMMAGTADDCKMVCNSRCNSISTQDGGLDKINLTNLTNLTIMKTR